MSDNSDYEEILQQNVRQVKKTVRDMESPDYSRLYELEEEGKDRKTVKEFLEPKMQEQDEEETVDEETVEAIEEDTSEGLLESFTREKVAGGAIVLGVLIGLAAGYTLSGGAQQASPAEVESSIQELFEATGFNGTMEFNTVGQNGMYYVQINQSQQTVNGTETSTRAFYASPDGQLLFPEIRSQLLTNPINVQQTLMQLQQRAQQPTTGNQTGNSTS